MSNSNSNSKTPLILIGVVVVAALVGVYYLMNMPKTPSAPNKNTASNSSTPAVVNAPGADPPRMLGSEKATVVVEEFADFQCPVCGKTHPMMKEIQSSYGSRIKFIFREFPLNIPAHDKAYDAAVAAEAAGMQGKFWEMQNLLFTNQSTWSASADFKSIWEDYAKQIGINVEQWKNDMAGMNAKSRISADLARGNALRVNSTPSLFVNGMLVPPAQMDIASIKQIIDAELAKAPAPNAASSAPAPANKPAANAAK